MISFIIYIIGIVLVNIIYSTHVYFNFIYENRKIPTLSNWSSDWDNGGRGFASIITSILWPLAISLFVVAFGGYYIVNFVHFLFSKSIGQWYLNHINKPEPDKLLNPKPDYRSSAIINSPK